MIPQEYRPLASGKCNRASMAAAVQFVVNIWDYESDAFTFIATRIDGAWREHPIQGRNRLRAVRQILADHNPELYDIYFCPNAFSEPHRRAEFALPSRYAWCDIDAADPAGYKPEPNVSWETSPGRFQGIWIWRQAYSAHAAARYSRALVYKYGGDKGGWSITKMLRLPGTVNHKSHYSKPVVTLKEFDLKPRKLPPSLSGVSLRQRKAPTISGAIELDGIDPHDVMLRYKSQVPPMARTLMLAPRILYPDRSEAIFIIVSALVTVNASDAEIVSVLLINPHFIEKHGEDAVMAEREVVCIRTKTEDGQ